MTGSRFILVAEDEDNDFLLLERAFAKHDNGVTVARVRDGVEVINYFSGADKFDDRRKFPLPDLLLLDLKMPRKDGFETLQWVRSHPVFRSVVVVVFSSSTQERDINRAYR